MAEEDLLASVRQLVSKVEPSIRAANTVSEAEDMLLHLEETDENFHRYEFVKYLRSKISDSLSTLMDEEIEKSMLESRGKGGGEEEVITTITERIVNSPEYSKLTQSLKEQTKDAVDRLLETFDEDVAKERKILEGSPSPRKTAFPFSDDSSSFDASFNQPDLVFPNQEKFQLIASNLDVSNPLQTRREALRQLCQIPPPDVIVCDQWSNLEQGLMMALADDDEELADKSLQFHAKMFSANSHNVTKDVYSNLAAYLETLFQTHQSKASIPIADGVNTADPTVQRILRKFRLVNEFQLQVPSYWVRYPEKFLDDVIECTLSLLSRNSSVPTGPSGTLTPLHYLALLDPKATWFRKWMHGNYSRTAVLKILEKHRSLIDNSVRFLMDFVSERKSCLDSVSDITEKMKKSKIGEGIRMLFTTKELEYLYFVHSLSIVGALLLYSNGREFFPIKQRDKEVSISDLLVLLITLLSDGGTELSTKAATFDPGNLVTDMLKTLSAFQAVCSACMWKNKIITELTNPLKMYLKGKKIKDATLLHIADILSVMASSQCGRQILLYGEARGRLQHNKTAAVHTIAEFAKKALSRSLPSQCGPLPSRAVIGAYVFICRQLYSNCEGLHILYPYGLHTYIADAWREASRDVERVPTPRPESDGENSSQSSKQESIDAFAWEETLLDNLLNFAGTPKGLLMLQQTGAINECVEYMYVRYAKKLQVSKHEKFGYGTMVTQLAATAPGMVALQSAGFIKAVLAELWSVLECCPDDKRVIRPVATPVDPIDRTAHKSLMTLVNVLSAYPAVYEVIANLPLSNKETYTFREIPDTIPGFIERLIMVDTPGKIHSLFNVEQSQVFGLRVLSILSCCLDSALLLEKQYKIQDMLLQSQQMNRSRRDEGSDEFIIDMPSVERNHVLIRSYIVGGPSERVLPPRQLSDSDQPYPWPLFSQFPVPKQYTPQLTRPSAMKQENELTKFLASGRTEDVNMLWLDKCKKAFCTLLTRKADLATGKVLVDMLERVINTLHKIPDESIFPLKEYSGPDSLLKGHKLPEIQVLGVKMAVRYGQHLKILNNISESTEKLTMLIKQCRHYLKQQQRKTDSELSFLQDDYMGHDWFVSTLFLMMSGNRDKSWNFLHKFSTLVASAYLWLPRLHNSMLVPPQLTVSGIPQLFSTSGHHIELLLQTEVPLVFSAFKMSGYTCSQICQHWLRQCFWNYLDWQDICHYVCVCLLMGTDYQVYVCVAIFKHMQQSILLHAQHKDLQVFLKEEPIRDFHVGNYLEFMQELEQKYRKLVLADMKCITKP
ncbi:protein broad-minded-like [Ptychodera flava]|uniref:protein broad-minded-like n=1 Tax=Ptychodera flava TaxID=63121 RepID=UPI00396A4BDD